MLFQQFDEVLYASPAPAPTGVRAPAPNDAASSAARALLLIAPARLRFDYSLLPSFILIIYQPDDSAALAPPLPCQDRGRFPSSLCPPRGESDRPTSPRSLPGQVSDSDKKSVAARKSQFLRPVPSLSCSSLSQLSSSSYCCSSCRHYLQIYPCPCLCPCLCLCISGPFSCSCSCSGSGSNCCSYFCSYCFCSYCYCSCSCSCSNPCF